MRKLEICVLLCAPLSGCSSVLARSSLYEPVQNREPIYPGVARDVKLIGDAISGGSPGLGEAVGAVAWGVIDFPFSLTFDTALLPIDVLLWAVRDQPPTKGSCQAAPPRMSEEVMTILRQLERKEFTDSSLAKRYTSSGKIKTVSRLASGVIEVSIVEVMSGALFTIEKYPGVIRVRLVSPADAADFYKRVTGQSHPKLARGGLSAEYKAFLDWPPYHHGSPYDRDGDSP